MILTKVLGGLTKGKYFKYVLIVIFKLINHMQWLPHRFEGPPNKENIYSPAIVPLRIK